MDNVAKEILRALTMTPSLNEAERRALLNLDVNGEAICATRPWKTFGEGPASAGVQLSAQGFNEGKGKPFTAADVRYTASKDGRAVYIVVLGAPAEPLRLAAFGAGAPRVRALSILGDSAAPRWTQHADHLVIEPPAARPVADAALVLKASL